MYLYGYMDMDISNKYNFALMCKNKVKKENNQVKTEEKEN